MGDKPAVHTHTRYQVALQRACAAIFSTITALKEEEEEEEEDEGYVPYLNPHHKATQMRGSFVTDDKANIQ